MLVHIQLAWFVGTSLYLVSCCVLYGEDVLLLSVVFYNLGSVFLLTFFVSHPLNKIKCPTLNKLNYWSLVTSVKE